MTVPSYDKVEFVGEVIDIFEDFLDEREIKIDNPEKEEDEYAAIIYGSDYDYLSERLSKLFERWGVLSEK